MDRYSGKDQPQLQWLEDMVNTLLRGLAACFVVFWRQVRGSRSSHEQDE